MIIKLKAGLGNQMFQYAFAKLLQAEYGINNVLFDISYFDNKSIKQYLENGLDLLSVNYDIASKKDLHEVNVLYNNFKPHHLLHRFFVALQAIFNPKYYFEKKMLPKDVNSLLNYSYLDGYWQSWRYLEPIKSTLLNDFQPRRSLSELSKGYISRYQSMSSVMVGVRKGDYTKGKKAISKFGAPSLDYYETAIKIILEKVEKPVFVVFSDDIEWVKENLTLETRPGLDIAVEYREKNKVNNDFEELFVMASCKHAIISNSTFNFWGAWLIRNPDKIVVAPKEWFKDNSPIDIVPSTWIKI